MSFHRFPSLSTQADCGFVVPALRTAALLILSTAGIAMAHAQASASAPAAVQATPALQFPALDTSSSQLFSSSSSSSDDAADSATAPATLASVNPAAGNHFAEMMQYGGGQRRRYGAPRYRGSNTTADGTPKYTFFAGVGLVQPIGNTWHYFTPSYGFQVGAGRNFDRHLGVMLQFDYDHMGLTKSTLTNQSDLYFNDPNAGDNGLDGAMHVWSFSLDPVYTLTRGDSGGFGAYVVGGAGFYHKVSTFTVPQQEEYCSIYYGCGIYTVNGTFDQYVSNAPGFSGGFGATYKFSRFSQERFYAEARYVVTLNSQRAGYIESSSGTPVASGPNADPNNYFPANSHRTTYIPIKAGIRF